MEEKINTKRFKPLNLNNY